MSDEKEKSVKLLSATMDLYTPMYAEDSFSWVTSKRDIDSFSIDSLKTYTDVVNLSRFFYKRDPLASTVINKLIDIGVGGLFVEKRGLTANEYKIYSKVVENLGEFLESCALEYLISGLAVLEISYGLASKFLLKKWGVKKLDNIIIPTDFWVRDSSTILINRPFIGSKSSYYLVIPSNIVYFIKNDGQYPDGTKDADLWKEVNSKYPEFISRIKSGEVKIKLENPLVIERRKLSNSPYPLPYLYAALESMKYKRNLRKMDYSIASRVISAIQLIKMGNDSFPLLEDDTKALDQIRDQLKARTRTDNYERLVQLFSNHTLQIEWVMPDVTALLDDAKYRDINADILFALGFPRILVTGETEKSNTSNPEYALLSPIKTMENMREKLMFIVGRVIEDVMKFNGFSTYPVIKFLPINLHAFTQFVEILFKLYESGNLSRASLAEFVGYDIQDQFDQRKEERDQLSKLGLEDFAPTPHSNAPSVVGDTVEQNEDDNE